MRADGNTLHFVNRVDPVNCGDSMVTPLLYYYDFFSRYQLLRHDINSIDYDSISPSDIVILGGGGLLNYSEAWNLAINRLLDSGAAVIAWSPGFNSHTDQEQAYTTEIRFDKFALLSVRDYENAYGLPYLPDVTCKLPGLKKQYEVKRGGGSIARHKDFPIGDYDFEAITNSADIDQILTFLGESDYVVSNSYHMLYWSLLMGKKTICASPFSDKFFGYKYKPAYYPEDGSLEECAEIAQRYDVLEECIRETDAFFEKVRELVEQRLKPAAGIGRYYDVMTEYATLRTTLAEPVPLNYGVRQSLRHLALALRIKYPRSWSAMLPIRRLGQLLLGINTGRSGE